MSLREALLKQDLPESIRFRLEFSLENDSSVEELQLYTYLVNKEVIQLSQLTGLTLEEADVYIKYFHAMSKSEIESQKTMDKLMNDLINPFIQNRDVKAICLLKSLTADGNRAECHIVNEEIKKVYWKWREKDEEDGFKNRSLYVYEAKTDEEKALMLGLTNDEFLNLLETLQTLHKVWMVKYNDPTDFHQKVIKPHVEKENYKTLLNIYRGIPRDSTKYSLFLVLHKEGLI